MYRCVIILCADTALPSTFYAYLVPFPLLLLQRSWKSGKRRDICIVKRSAVVVLWPEHARHLFFTKDGG